jgi:hypothetical protein
MSYAMKVGSFQGAVFLQASFPRTRESRFVLVELAWIPAPAFARACFRIAGMTELNLYPPAAIIRTSIFEGEPKFAKWEWRSILRHAGQGIGIRDC